MQKYDFTMCEIFANGKLKGKNTKSECDDLNMQTENIT